MNINQTPSTTIDPVKHEMNETLPDIPKREKNETLSNENQSKNKTKIWNQLP